MDKKRVIKNVLRAGLVVTAGLLILDPTLQPEVKLTIACSATTTLFLSNKKKEVTE